MDDLRQGETDAFLVYSDWLEEQGEQFEAEFARFLARQPPCLVVDFLSRQTYYRTVSLYDGYQKRGWTRRLMEVADATKQFHSLYKAEAIAIVIETFQVNWGLSQLHKEGKIQLRFYCGSVIECLCKDGSVSVVSCSWRISHYGR